MLSCDQYLTASGRHWPAPDPGEAPPPLLPLWTSGVDAGLWCSAGGAVAGGVATVRSPVDPRPAGDPKGGGEGRHKDGTPGLGAGVKTGGATAAALSPRGPLRDPFAECSRESGCIIEAGEGRQCVVERDAL